LSELKIVDFIYFHFIPYFYFYFYYFGLRIRGQYNIICNNYNIDQALNPEEWDGNFHATSLHRAMEHLASDIKNIKDFLHRMGKYIRDKPIDNTNPNNIKDLESIGNVV